MPEKENYKQEHGILYLIDLVGFTTQDNKLHHYTQNFLNYYYDKAREVIEKHSFEFIKSDGDAVLFFADANKTQGFIQIILDLFREKKIEDSYGCKVVLRMVAHCGYFYFWLNEEGKKIDFTGSEGIKLFRMEKLASEEQVIITDELFKGLSTYLEQYHIPAFKEFSPIPLKGFTNDKVYVYRPFPGKEKDATENWRCRLEELKDRVKEIPIFGGLYPAVDIEKSFINLRIDLEKASEYHTFYKKMPEYGKRLGVYDEREYKEDRPQEIFTAEELFNTFNKGFIYGIPGSGKTTILHYNTFKTKDMLPIYIKCQNLVDFEQWCKIKHYKPTEAGYYEPDINVSLEYFTYGFLFQTKNPDSLSPEDYIALQEAEQQVRGAWTRNCLSLYIDGLDETDKSRRKRIFSMVKLIMSEIQHKTEGKHSNRVFLTSRPIERREYDGRKEPVFDVAPIDPYQVRQLALIFWGEKSELYCQFDNVVWKEEVVKKVAGTPLTALLLITYYQQFRKIDKRYPMYDLLLKFFLLKLWDSIEEKRLNDINKFFKMAMQDELYPDVWDKYNCLSRLSYECLYESKEKEGQPLRNIPTFTIEQYFRDWMQE